MRIDEKNEQKLQQIPVVLYWAQKPESGFGSYERFFYNCSNGKKGYDLRKVVENGEPYNLIAAGSYRHINGFSIQWDEELQLFIVIKAKFNATKVYYDSKDKIREWQEVERFYFDLNKTIYSKKYDWQEVENAWKYLPISDEYFEYKNGDAYAISSDMTKLHSINYDHSTKTDKSIEILWKKFPKFVTLSGNKIKYLNNIASIIAFLRYKEPIKKDGPKQKLIDELVKIKLPDVKLSVLEGDKDKNIANYAYLQRVPIKNKNICVLRTFKFFKNENEFFEGARYYITEKECIACKKDNSGNYIQVTLNDSSNWNFRFRTIEKDAAKGTMLEYCIDIIKEFSPSLRSIAVMGFTKWPVFELLYKAGYKALVKDIFKEGQYSNLLHTLEYKVGKTAKGNNLNKIFGLNKRQLSIVLDDMTNKKIKNNFYGRNTIFCLKAILSNTYSNVIYRDNFFGEYISISDMDDNTFDKLFQFCSRISQNNRFDEIGCYKISETVILDAATKTKDMFGMKTMLNMLDSIHEAGQKSSYVYGIRHDNPYAKNYIKIYHDYLNMLSQMDMGSRCKPYFNNLDELVAMHDEVTKVLNLKKDEFNRKKFNERKVVWNKFLYSDSNYSIIAPNLPEDIAEEGIALRHCVKSYIDKVTNGKTNILFIRKTNELDKPFFTIEISDDGSVQQIRGFGNRNVNTEPDMIYFVGDWIKHKNLKACGYNKIR